MKKNLVIITLIFAIPLIAYFALTREASYASKSASNTINKPQVLKFTSLMCIDCKKMNDSFKAVFPKYSEKVALVEVSVQSDNSFVKSQIAKYGVTLVPTLVFISADGKKVKKVEGYLDKTALDKRLRDLLNE